ncbi:MAG: hypothetical protein LUC49_02140 [Prevotella sp.]|nr:hypothetical protein [Prevotella sp.]
MKKIMTMALVALFAASAFAQNPDALKQIKKSKSAEEVKALISANEATMSAAENAQAYNKLTDIYMTEVSKAQTAIQTNELQKQMGQEPKEEVDMPAFYSNLKEALEAALTCDKYDIQPNEKDKVAPKFRKANGDRLYNLRVQLINGGQDAQEKDDNDLATSYYTLYVVSGKADLFAEQAEAAKKLSPDGVADPYISEVARVVSLSVFNSGDVDLALKFTDIVLEDPEKLNDGLSLKMYYLEKSLKTKEDSLKCLEAYKDLYAQYPQNENVFSQLANMYANLGQTAEQEALIEQCLQSDPNNFTAWAMKGQNAMNDQVYDEALTNFQKALSCDEEDTGKVALVNTFVGFCYSQQAAQLEEYDQQLETLKLAIPYLEKARELDPERERCNWAYPLYNCYYHIKGENDAVTEELRVMLGL